MFLGPLLALLLLAACPAAAQDGTEGTAALEGRLAQATGRHRLELLVELSRRHAGHEPTRAVAFGEEALALLRSGPDLELEIELSNLLARIFFRLRDPQSALLHGGRAERLSRVHGNHQQLASALHLIGDVYRSLADYRRALEATNEAAALYLQIGDQHRLATALNDAGLAYRRIGDYSQALQVYLRSRQIRAELGDPARLAHSLTNLGVVYRHLGQNDAALEAYDQALVIQQQEGNLPAVARLLNNIGIVNKLEGETAAAIENYSRSLAIKERLGDFRGIASTLNNLGLAREDLGEIDRAEADFRRSLSIKERLGERQGVAGTLVRLAAIQRQRQDYDRALELLEQAMAEARQSEDRVDMRGAYRELSETLAAVGRYQQALSAFESYKKVKREILQQQGREAVAAMRVRFESDQKEREAALLTQQQLLATLELRQQETNRQALVTGFSLLALTALLIASRYRLKVRTTRTIEAQNRDLEQTVAELSESQQRYRRLFDDPSLAKLLVDPATGKVVDANASAAEILGWSAAELGGRSLTGLGRAWLRRIADQLDPEHTRGRATWVGAFQHQGSVVHDFEAWVSYVWLDGRQVALVTLHDLTEHSRLEEETLRREERERYLYELQIRNAEVEARNAEMERFVYIVSHDLKAPLVTIRGFVGLMEQDARAGDLERVRHDIERIDAAAGRMATFLDDLLELSRSGRVIDTPQTVSLAEVAQEAARIVADQGAGRQVDVQIADDLPLVRGDRQRLLEVLQNLIDNAVKFIGDQPEPRLEVGWRRRPEPVFFVSDNGIGLASEDRRRIFELFDRGSSRDLQQAVEGTGVGLAVVKRIVEVHGGRIWVESGGEGKGSTFCFTLPAAADGAQPPTSQIADRDLPLI